MNFSDISQVILYFVILTAITPFLGQFMANVYEDKLHFLKGPLGWLENLFLSFIKIKKDAQSSWKEYVKDLLVFNFIGFLFVFLIQIFQKHLPLNPQQLDNTTWHLSLNNAISFITNTNWQSYAGETTMSYFTQMLALTVQNFLSAATGMAVVVALIRGLRNKCGQMLGNFWVDMNRSVTYILLPLSVVFAIFLVGQGVVQNFSPATQSTTLEGETQIIPQGPAASQIAIKQLGTNGGGFFNTNSAHPFENPTPLSNFLQMLAILLIPAALTYTFGAMIGSRKQGWAIYITMFALLILFTGASLWSEYTPNSYLEGTAIMEGKEQRIGVTNTILWSTVTTAASNGSVNGMHSSLSPLSGGIALFNMMLGEVIFGGVGAGLYGMLIFVILTVFIAGLMVGRSPEYLGKKIEAYDVVLAIIAVLIPNFLILIGAGLSAVLPDGLSSLANKGPHGLSEILYAFSSAAGNNGSAFAGLNANTPYYNVMLGVAMLVARFGVILPALALAGNLSNKKISPPSSGTFPTDSLLFVVLLAGVIVIVAGLTFLPALCLGPIIEHFMMINGSGF